MRPSLRTPRGALLALFVGACDGDSPSGPVPVATVQVSAPYSGLLVGETVQFTATTSDARGSALSGRTITWTSSQPTVATVTLSGLATAVSTGVTTIEAESEGKRAQLTLTVVPPAPPVSATGQLFMIDGLAPGPLTAALRTGGSPPKSAAIGADGRFGLSSVAPGDPVDLLIDGPSGAYLPSLLRFPRALISATELRILLAPRRWTIGTGTYSSTAIDVSPTKAFTPPCATAGDINCDGFYPAAWVSGIKVWDDATLPAPLAFDHLRSAAPISASDSVALWAIVRKMEADMGRALFRPATATDLAIEADGWSSGAVLVRVDAALAPGRGFTNWRWDGRGVVFAAVVRAASASVLGSSGVVTHELLHAIGLKHSCAWPSVMGGYGCPIGSGLTPQDVGYAQLAIQLSKIQRANNAYRNLYDAMQGERVVLLGLAPAGLTLAEALGFPRVSRGGEDGAH